MIFKIESLETSLFGLDELVLLLIRNEVWNRVVSAQDVEYYGLDT